jgi:flavin reductase (DIM6/NTAB) family NADH-FMN oxidoreductase RutF
MNSETMTTMTPGFQSALPPHLARPALDNETEMDRTGFSMRALRDVLGLFPTGVTVVTTKGPDGTLNGVTVSSFNSVSLEPALILFSLSRKSKSLPTLLEASSFAINFLRQSQKDISARFASSTSDKWAGVAHRPGVTGCPCIEGALAVLECSLYAHYDGGDHVIIVGRVLDIESHPDNSPLVFYRGNYHSIAAPSHC